MKKLILSITTLIALNTFSQEGQIDSTFALNGIYSQYFSGDVNEAKDVVIQSDGKIVIVGNFGTQNESSVSDIGVIRLNSNGTLDTSFGSNGSVIINVNNKYELANAVALTSDGKILVAGSSDDDIAVYRLNSNGTMDAGFGTNGSSVIVLNTIDNLFDIKVAADGKFFVAGHAYFSSGSDFLVAKFNINGTLDNTFATSAVVDGVLAVTFNNYDYGKTIELDASGDVYVTGISFVTGKGYCPAAARINSDGNSLDVSFASVGKAVYQINNTANDEVYSSLLLADGSLLLGGLALSGSKSLVMKLVDGDQDSSFGTDGVMMFNPQSNSINSCVFDMQQQADGKIVLAGQSNQTSYYGFSLSRINLDGSLDSSFMIFTDITSGNDVIYGMAFQSDGGIVVAGKNGNNQFAAARYFGVENTASVESMLNDEMVHVYPNPASESISINVKSPTKVTISNITGEIFESLLIENKESIDLSNYKSGLYFVTTENGKTIKIIKD